LSLAASQEECLFLIDTGADISLLKGDKLIDSTEFDPGRKATVKSVNGSPIDMHGVVEKKVNLGDNPILHDFHLVSKQVDIPCDGILGRDF
jgi:hypothetical protein